MNLHLPTYTKGSQHPLAILIYTSVKILGDMLTKKVKMYGDYVKKLRGDKELTYLGESLISEMLKLKPDYY